MIKVSPLINHFYEIGFFWLYLFIFLILVGCNSHKNNDIILQIGTYKLEKADLVKIRKDNKIRNLLSDDQLERRLIEDGYILAHALENKFDTISILKKQLEYASRMYVSEVGGFVWNNKVKPFLKVRNDDVLDAYNKRGMEYELELIQFPNKSLLENYVNTDFNLNSVKGFNLLKNRVATNHEVKFTRYIQRFPFYPLGTYFENLHEGKVGDVFGPVEGLNGYYIVHIADRWKIKQEAFEKEYPQVENELLNRLKDKYIWESQKEIFSSTNPVMEDKALEELAKKYNKEKREWLDVDSKSVLMQYDFKGRRIPFLAANFFEFVECQPVLYGSLTNPDEIKGMLKSYLIGEYLFTEAQEMHVESDSEYILFKKLFTYKLYINHYKQKNIPQISFDEGVLSKFYNENRNDYNEFESATVSVFIFKDIQIAYSSLNHIYEYFKPNSRNKIVLKEIPDLLSFDEKLEISPSDTSYSSNLVENILQLNVNQISRPFEVNGNYWVVYLKEKKGSAILPYKYMKGKIRNSLSQKKAQETQDQLLTKLKAIYPIKINRLKEYFSK